MNIELTDTITVNGADGKPTEQNITKWTPEFVSYMLAYAHGVRMQRCTASAKDPDAARQAMFDSMAAGEVPSGGGGGPRLSVEDAGMIAFFNSKGSPVKFVKQSCNGKNLEQYVASFVQKAIWPSVRAAIANLDKDAQMRFHKEKLPAIVAANTEKVLAVAQADPNGMGGFIEAERMKRDGKKPEQFAVDIEINI